MPKPVKSNPEACLLLTFVYVVGVFFTMRNFAAAIEDQAAPGITHWAVDNYLYVIIALILMVIAGGIDQFKPFIKNRPAFITAIFSVVALSALFFLVGVAAFTFI